MTAFEHADLPNHPHIAYERHFWRKGYTRIAGLDEAGRGALAGPVCAAVVILPCGRQSLLRTLSGVRDSKQMSPHERDAWAPRIQETALDWGVGFASPDEIDILNILGATRLAAMRAIDCLSSSPDYLLTDYLLLSEVPLPQSALVKGDQLCLSIAAASVLAKTSRDALMRQLDAQYPGYGFARHKGYGTTMHRQSIVSLGVSAVHRRSFSLLAG
ncbi:MAG: ribonuclease HII [Chloroflexota bacterium]